MRSASWRLAVAGVVLAATALPAVAHATTSECTWVESDLPLPAGIVSATVNGSDGQLTFVGTAYTRVGGPGQGIVWQNGTPHLLGYAANSRNTQLSGIDSAGDAVGEESLGSFEVPVLYHNGGYEGLTAPFASASELVAYGINANGDVVGTALENNGTNVFVVWPAGRPSNPRTLPIPGSVDWAGIPYIEDDGYIASYNGVPNAYVWAPDGTPTALTPVKPGDSTEVFDIRGGRILGFSGGSAGSTIVEWDTAGNVIRTLPDVATYSRVLRINANDTVLGESTAGGQQYGLWQQGQLIGRLAAPANAQSIVPVVLTDGDIVGGSYTVSGGASVPAEWECGGPSITAG
jgi:hypothetical protein